MAKSFKVGEAPWEKEEKASFKVGEAPWEKEQVPEETPMVTGKGLLKGTLEALPMAGSMFGGAAGFLSPVPGGTILGAGGGAAVGKSLQNLGEKYLLGEEKTREDIYGGPAKAALEGVTAEVGGQLIGPALKAAGGAIKNTASSLSKIPKSTIDTYIKRGKDVDKLVEKYGANTQESANAVRQEINDTVMRFKNKQNATISKSLENRKDIIDVSDAVKELETTIKKLDPDVDAKKIAQIQEQLDLINKVAPDGVAPIKKAQSLKMNLQDLADYLEPGQFFKKKGLIDVSFERAASNLNKSISKAAPEIKEANKNLQAIRRATKNLNRNLLKEGETEASLIAASQGTDKNAVSLKKLGELTGSDFTTPIQDVAAQKAFADPGLLPGFNTGAATIPLLLGGGYAAQQAMEGNFENAGKGLLLGSLGSPLALKYGINASRPLLKNSPEILKMLKESPKGLIRGDNAR